MIILDIYPKSCKKNTITVINCLASPIHWAVLRETTTWQSQVLRFGGDVNQSLEQKQATGRARHVKPEIMMIIINIDCYDYYHNYDCDDCDCW